MAGIIFAVAALIVLSAYILLNYYPPFGGKLSREQIHTFTSSPNFAGDRFVNQIPTSMGIHGKDLISLLRDFIRGNPRKKPDRPISVYRMSLGIEPGKGRPKATWFGHSTVLLEMEGSILFIDPMMGNASSPFPRIGSKRFSQTLPAVVEELPYIDAVIMTHDHYDHLDYPSIKKLHKKVGRFIVPLGLGNHLIRWGVDPSKISEHDWWDELDFRGLKLACTPAWHFSGRKMLGRDTALWCSWVIEGEESKAFFSGDSGYAPHFKEIGEKYGPFDLTFIEGGQYDMRWSNIHMFPEESVQAHLDVKGRIMVLVHWSAFTLSLHDWDDPIRRAVISAKEHDVILATPRIGEPVFTGSADCPNSEWWSPPPHS